MVRLLLLFSGLWVFTFVGGQDGGSIIRSTLSSLGSTSFNADNGILIRHTVGQPPGTDVFTTEEYGILRQGFQQPVEHPSVTSSPLPFDEDPPGRFGFSIYPNPANDWVDIVLSDDTGPFEIYITNIHGKRVYHGKESISYRVTLNLQPLRPGVYFITVVCGGERSTGKLIVL